jgi:head-tail adaptor
MPVGEWRNVVALEAPTPVRDGEGGYVDTWAPLTPGLWDCSIRSAGPHDLERSAAGTTAASASHVLGGRYHAGVTTQTRIRYTDPDRGERLFSVIYVENVGERGDAMTLLVTEVVE